MEEADRRAQALPFATLFDHLPSLVFVTAGDGPNVYVNSAFERYTGLPREALLGRAWVETLHPDDLDRLYRRWFAAFETNAAFECEYRLRNAAGDYRWQVARAVPVNAQGGCYWVGTVTDVHDRVAAEAKARARQEQIQLAQDAAGVGAYDWDIVTDTLVWNDGCKRVFGLPLNSEVSYQRFRELLHPDDRGRTDAIVARALDPADPDDSYNTEYRVILPGGAVRWVDARGRVLFVASSTGRTPTRFIGTVLDVTARKHVEQELAEAVAARDMLLAEVNHRVKNSLQVVSALLTLQSSRMPESDARGALEEARERVALVASIHQRLYVTGEHAQLDIGAFGRAIAEDTLTSAGLTGRVGLSFSATPGLQIDMARGVPLVLVLNELITNAIKYALRTGGGSKLEVSLTEQGGRLRMRVADDGPGLPSGVDLGNPSGLGLKIATSLARQLGGRLQATPLSPGVEFVLDAPLG